MKISKKILATSTIILSAITLAACGNQSASQKKKQVLNWSETTQLSTQDPSLATDTTSFQALLNTGDGLYRLDKNNKPQLSLATKAKTSNNGKTYDFYLRKNAKWSNGDPITAKDFVYSYRRTVNPATKSQMAFYLYQIKNAQAINSGKKAAFKLRCYRSFQIPFKSSIDSSTQLLQNLACLATFLPTKSKSSAKIR